MKVRYFSWKIHCDLYLSDIRRNIDKFATTSAILTARIIQRGAFIMFITRLSEYETGL